MAESPSPDYRHRVRSANLRRLLAAIWSDPLGRRWLLLSQAALVGQVVFDLAMMKGRTSFVIAHRLSTIRDSDVIVAINDGRVVDVGSHDELMAAKGFYHDLYLSQFRGDAAPAAP
jgi:ABC-type enterochelin transport system ATPase subunit